MRATYGVHSVFTEMALRALESWKAYEIRWKRTFFRRTGALWMFATDRGEEFAHTSKLSLDRRTPIEWLSPSAAAHRYPAIDFDGVSTILFEPEAGYLLARRACEHVVRCAISEGAEFRVAAARPPRLDGSTCAAVALHDGERVEADQFVFACGPWLRTLFPEILGEHLSVTRQEVHYFGVPSGSRAFDDVPVWLDFGARLFYGIPGDVDGAFKIADDTPGPPFDPTAGDRTASPREVDRARAFLGTRFPSLRTAPLVRSEVCQYESTPDAHFIVDRHPSIPNLWIVGGGSGHGYKMGPAIGELVAGLVCDGRDPEPRFALDRFSRPPTGGWREKWS